MLSFCWGHLEALYRCRRPLSYTFRAAAVSLSLGSFELKYLSSHVVVPGQREGGGEASIRPALFRRPPLWLRERDTWTKPHINRHPPRELLSYTTPTTSHQLPQSLKREREERGQRCRGGKTAALHPDEPKPKLLSSWLPWQPAETQQHGGLKLAIWPKTNKVLVLNLTDRLCVDSAVFMWAPSGAPSASSHPKMLDSVNAVTFISL